MYAALGGDDLKGIPILKKWGLFFIETGPCDLHQIEHAKYNLFYATYLFRVEIVQITDRKAHSLPRHIWKWAQTMQVLQMRKELQKYYHFWCDD